MYEKMYCGVKKYAVIALRRTAAGTVYGVHRVHNSRIRGKHIRKMGFHGHYDMEYTDTV